MKPVEMIEYLLGNNTHAGDIVLDSFGGSGTTLIAAERLQRKCRMLELDPCYCDVIVQRWQDYTGQVAVHAAIGASFADRRAAMPPPAVQTSVLPEVAAAVA